MSADKENSKSEGIEGEERVSIEDLKPDSKVEMEEKKEESGDRKEKDAPKKRGKAKEARKEVKSETEEEEEEEEEEPTEENGEDKDSDGKVPLLDQPLELSGTRERKQVQRFAAEYTTEPKDSVAIEVPDGKGTPLGSIPRVEGSIQKSKPENLKPLHRVLFNRIGKIDAVKKNIRKFNGFDFETNSDQFTKKLAFLQKMDAKTLRGICFTLDLPGNSKRDVLAEHILTFLMDPQISGKHDVKDRPKRSQANNKSYSESDDEELEKRSRPRGKGKRVNLKEESSADEHENETEKPESKKKAKPERKRKETEDSKDKENSTGEEDNEKDEDDKYAEEDGDSSEESDEPKSKAKKGGSRKVNSKKAAPKKGNTKKPAPKKTEKKAPPKKKAANTDDEEDDESSGDEPLAKKSKSPPTDEEIKSYLKEILEGADLEETTMKIVCKKVYAHYPEFDLAHKKDFIKTTVKSLIST